MKRRGEHVSPLDSSDKKNYITRLCKENAAHKKTIATLIGKRVEAYTVTRMSTLKVYTMYLAVKLKRLRKDYLVIIGYQLL